MICSNCSGVSGPSNSSIASAKKITFLPSMLAWKLKFCKIYTNSNHTNLRIFYLPSSHDPPWSYHVCWSSWYLWSLPVSFATLNALSAQFSLLISSLNPFYCCLKRIKTNQRALSVQRMMTTQWRFQWRWLKIKTKRAKREKIWWTKNFNFLQKMTCIANFELLNILGTGSYATVHKAIDKRTRQLVAVKTMERKKILRGQFGIENLVQEIELLKKLNHKNIVNMVDFCWDNTNIYIIMELCEISLSTLIKKRQRLSESTCRIFIRMLADAMRYLRENNVSHFDLKPQNLLLTRPSPSATFVLKICDFGWVRLLECEIV